MRHDAFTLLINSLLMVGAIAFVMALVVGLSAIASI